MPREITHWNILEEATLRLGRMGDALPACYACLTQARAAAFLGAMAHDAPYYLEFGSSEFEITAELLHGTNGEDTLKPLLAMLAAAFTEPRIHERQQIVAFVLGMLSHFATDIVFHPMVYYFTGNYYDSDKALRHQARRKHRLFEVHLDSYFRVRTKLWNNYKISQCLSAVWPELTPITDALGRVCSPSLMIGETKEEDLSSAEEWRSSFRYMAFAQFLFVSGPAGRVVRLLNSAFRGRLAEIEALVSTGRTESDPFFDGNISYRNPVTGASSSETIDSMRELAVTEFISILRRCEALLAKSGQVTPEDIRLAFHGVEAKSLNFGVPNAPHEQAKYFADEELPFLIR